MLSTPPNKMRAGHIGGVQFIFWERMNPMLPLMFETYLRKIDVVWNIIDLENSSYQEWESMGKMNYGFRHQKTRKKHGIVRSVGKLGSIREATYKNDIEHGLERKIMRHECLIRLWYNGQCIANL